MRWQHLCDGHRRSNTGTCPVTYANHPHLWGKTKLVLRISGYSFGVFVACVCRPTRAPQQGGFLGERVPGFLFFSVRKSLPGCWDPTVSPRLETMELKPSHGRQPGLGWFELASNPARPLPTSGSSGESWSLPGSFPHPYSRGKATRFEHFPLAK